MAAHCPLTQHDYVCFRRGHRLPGAPWLARAVLYGDRWLASATTRLTAAGVDESTRGSDAACALCVGTTQSVTSTGQPAATYCTLCGFTTLPCSPSIRPVLHSVLTASLAGHAEERLERSRIRLAVTAVQGESCAPVFVERRNGFIAPARRRRHPKRTGPQKNSG